MQKGSHLTEDNKERIRAALTGRTQSGEHVANRVATTRRKQQARRELHEALTRLHIVIDELLALSAASLEEGLKP